ncbi:MAG: capsule assembly Wzi family protein [Tannerella sp.]|jgi:hypothetical protein|nr:capsule assembly Wzi family protein [Tannerella sp.]
MLNTNKRDVLFFMQELELSYYFCIRLMIQQAKITCIFFLFTSIINGYAQDAYTSYQLKTFGSVSTNGQTPFWIVSNQYGIIPLKSANSFLQLGIINRQSLRKIRWDTEIDLIISTPRYRNVYIQQLYTAFAYNWLHLSIGAKNDQSCNSPLINPFISSGSLAQSLNARPIPEINLYVPEFITIPVTGGWLQTKGHFAVSKSFDSDYLKSFINHKEVFISNKLWHHKSLHFRIKDTRNNFPLSAIFGIHHTVQWGGTSTNPKIGKQPQSIKDFIRVIVGKSGGNDASDSDQINALGAHYGVYDFGLHFEKEGWSIGAYYQHIFGDKSGMKFKNKFDGLKGIQINLPIPWVQSVVIENLSTLNQSGPFHFIEYDHDKYPGYGGGADNYYNNQEYRTGYSYFNRSIGSPLLISPEYNSNGDLGFKHNRIRAWHIGASGRILKQLNYRILLSDIKSFGTAYKPTLKKRTSMSFTTDFTYNLNDSWIFSASMAADNGSLLGDHFGFSLSVAKRGFLRK